MCSLVIFLSLFLWICKSVEVKILTQRVDCLNWETPTYVLGEFCMCTWRWHEGLSPVQWIWVSEVQVGIFTYNRFPGDLKHATEKLASILLKSMNADIFTETPETEDLKSTSGFMFYHTLWSWRAGHREGKRIFPTNFSSIIWDRSSDHQAPIAIFYSSLMLLITFNFALESISNLFSPWFLFYLLACDHKKYILR